MAQLTISDLGEDVERELDRRARRQEHTEENLSEIPRNAEREESASRMGLGSRLVRRFMHIGLGEDEHLPELPFELPRPADFES